MTSAVSIRSVFAMPLFWLAATTVLATMVEGDPDSSLISVYDNLIINGEPVEYNPSDYTIHDPSRIVTVGDKQMIAVTGKAQEEGYNCGIETWWRKKDGEGDWKPGQCLFRTKPSWVGVQAELNDGAFWAPELDLEDGALTLLYSVSEMDAREGGPNTCVGVAKSTTGLKGFPDNLTWEDVGEPLTCISGSSYVEERSAIDPSTFWGFGKNKDKLFLVTGGGRIIGTELDPTTYLQKDKKWFEKGGTDWTELSTGPNSEDDNWVEAAFIYPKKKTGYYYLFVNWGACCSGVDSTYEIRVGRSKNPMGPYLDKKGVDMMNGGGTSFEKTKGDVIGPGHPAIWRKNRKKEYISFHYYDKRREGNSWIAEKQLRWRKGWPKTKKRIVSMFPTNRLNSDE